MPAFTYEAADAEGQLSRGIVEADSARAARNALRARGLVPMDLEAVTAGNRETAQPGQAPSLLRRKLWESRVFSKAALAVWTRQLAGLVRAGMPLERALTALAAETEDDRQRALVAALRSEVNAGSTFARALLMYPREFTDIYAAVVSAGEQSGTLGLVLEHLAADLEDGQALHAKLTSAALYPAIVTVIAVLIVMFLLGYVVPQVANVFAGSKRSLPLMTVVMLSISQFVRSYGSWLGLLALLLAFSGGRALRHQAIRLRFDAMWLSLPIIGRLARGYNAARFAATLAMLAAAGVPILKALQSAAETLHNRAMREDALDALVMVREGAPLASALAGKKRFPALLAMFARLGEQTGNLPAMLHSASVQQSKEVQHRSLQLVTILEPLLIVVMGIVVLLIVLAVLLPIIELNQLVR